MTTADIDRAIRQAVASVLNVRLSAVTDHLRFAEYAIDSLDILDLLVRLPREVDITKEQLREIETVGDLIRVAVSA